jgi:hypothetical protein
MAKKKNTLTLDVQNVHRSFAMANFAAGAADSSATRDKRNVQRRIDAGGANTLITMRALVGVDTYEPDPKLTSAISYGGAMIRGEETLSLLDESNASAQANALVDAHEAMERFVKSVTAKLMYSKRGNIPVNQNDRHAAENRFGKKAAKENTPQYFEQIVAVVASRNCDPLFRLLKKHVNTLDERTKNGHYGNYAEIHRAVEFIRHSKTHGNGRFNPTELAKLPTHSQEIVKAFVRRSVMHNDNRILPTHDEVSDLLKREAEFCQIIYDAVSNEMDMLIDYKPN